MNPALLSTALAGVLAAPAAGGSLHGSWCSDQLVLHLDAFGVGANEHTICDARPPPTETGAYYHASLDCKNVYPGERNANGTFEVTEVPIDAPNRITAILIEDERVAVLFETDGEGLLLDRCD